MEERISAEKRALGLSARAWQLAGNRWPPPSRAIAYQIVGMVANALRDASGQSWTVEDSMAVSRELLAPFLAQPLAAPHEQRAFSHAIRDALLDAEFGNTLPDDW